MELWHVTHRPPCLSLVKARKPFFISSIKDLFWLGFGAFLMFLSTRGQTLVHRDWIKDSSILRLNSQPSTVLLDYSNPCYRKLIDLPKLWLILLFWKTPCWSISIILYQTLFFATKIYNEKVSIEKTQCIIQAFFLSTSTSSYSKRLEFTEIFFSILKMFL